MCSTNYTGLHTERVLHFPVHFADFRAFLDVHSLPSPLSAKLPRLILSTPKLLVHTGTGGPQVILDKLHPQAGSPAIHPSERACVRAEGLALLSGPALPLTLCPGQHSLKDLVVLNRLLQVLKVGVDTADGSHIRLQQLNVSLLLGRREPERILKPNSGSEEEVLGRSEERYTTSFFRKTGERQSKMAS